MYSETFITTRGEGVRKVFYDIVCIFSQGGGKKFANILRLFQLVWSKTVMKNFICK